MRKSFTDLNIKNYNSLTNQQRLNISNNNSQQNGIENSYNYEYVSDADEMVAIKNSLKLNNSTNRNSQSYLMNRIRLTN